jgi:hypothetical protein
LTATEVDLGTAVPVNANEALLAIVKLVIAGSPASNSAYIVLQTSLDNGTTWVDVAWIVTTSTTDGTLVFILSAGVAGASGSAFTRATGTAPGSNSAIQIPLGGLIRFTGKAALTGGTLPTVKATINYKQLGLR